MSVALAKFDHLIDCAFDLEIGHRQWTATKWIIRNDKCRSGRARQRRRGEAEAEAVAVADRGEKKRIFIEFYYSIRCAMCYSNNCKSHVLNANFCCIFMFCSIFFSVFFLFTIPQIDWNRSPKRRHRSPSMDHYHDYRSYVDRHHTSHSRVSQSKKKIHPNSNIFKFVTLPKKKREKKKDKKQTH